MTVEEIKSRYPLAEYLVQQGVKLVGSGNCRKSNRCALKQHKPEHFPVSIDVSKGLFHCNDCGVGGDVIRWMALSRGIPDADVLRELGGTNGKSVAPATTQIVSIYSYENEAGTEVFQVCRMHPKTFRQRHRDEGGQWVWNMDGVTRVLYHLPEVLKANQVWIVEGEKDADNLSKLGYTATCNVCGAGKWLDAYTATLAGKEIILCGDNDKPGQDHIDMVFASLAGKAKNVRRLKVPAPSKDVSDWLDTFKTSEDAKAALETAVETALIFVKGVHVPIYSLPEIEPRFIKHVKNLRTCELNLGLWLPSLAKVRGLIPGELMTIVADTGQAKTFALQNIARFTTPLITLLFELELPEELVFERFLCMMNQWGADKIRSLYSTGDALGECGLASMRNVFVCTESGLTVEKIEQHINNAELKIGERPKVVLVDYVQLIRGMGKNRREVVADTAENLKILAKTTKTIVIMASQVARKPDDEREIFLHDPKESGSIESSSGLMLGMWRDPDDKMKLKVKVLKNTKGNAGMVINCRFLPGQDNSFSGRIVEESPIEP